MKRENFEIYKKEKDEYDKRIRELDYKIVEESVQLYNLLNRSKAAETKMMTKENDEKIYKLTDSIDKAEKTKEKNTKEIFSKFEKMRKELLEGIKENISNLMELDNKIINAKIKLDKIQDVYFDLNEIEPLVNYLEPKEKITRIKVADENKQSEIFIPKPVKQEIFDIPKQRIIDFENLLEYMHKISKNYRDEIEKELKEYIAKYDILSDSEIVQNKINNIKNDFISKFDETILKFKKDENLEELNHKVQNMIENNKQTEIQKQNILSETQIMKEQIEKLQDVYLVHNFAKKILNKFLTYQANKENVEANFQANSDVDTFKKIQKVTYDERIKHIIEVSKWTKNIETKLKYQNIKEKDFQVIIYIIRQTEDVCNMNYENITNLILELCEGYIELEEIEVQNNLNKMLLKQDMETSNILRNGINAIKRKYLKIPFVGRKVAYILDTKALNA